MIRVTIEVSGGGTDGRFAVVAPSIRHALEAARRRCPGTEARVVFPIPPEEFFVGGAARGEVPHRTVEDLVPAAARAA
jgi:hypothetical protein